MTTTTTSSFISFSNLLSDPLQLQLEKAAMSRSSEYHLGASSSSPPFRQLGGFSEEEECDTIGAKKKKKVTIEEEQQQKGMAERTPLQFQNEQEGKKKEDSVTIQGRKEEEYVKIQVEPDVPKMQGVEAQNSFSNYGHSNESESGHGVMSYAVLIILVVAEVILGLDFFGVLRPD